MKDYEVDEFYLVTNFDSKIKSSKELNGGIIYYNVDTEHYNKMKENLKKKTNAKIEETESLADTLVQLAEMEKVVILNSGIYQSITDNDPEYGKHLKIIDTIKIYVKKEKSKKKANVDEITTKPFIIFLSGIDTRGNTLVKKSLSDVNMLITVNPNTKTILLVSIPRDSYVQLHGYRGKDKLTHAGSLGGLELSKATVEDFMGVKADYYARVNFRAVINLVDAVGGITVQEDPEVKKRFKAWTNAGCWIEPGENHFGGECALAFARERYHYSKGDMQRNINQQKVLKALFDKMSTNTYTVAHYTDILNAVNGTFETDMQMEEIAALVKFQLNDLTPWKFESQNVVGGTGRTTTLSSGSTELSVVYPNQSSVNEAKEAIRKVLAGESLHPEENVAQ
jgi:LCP family protein required for cell wall assembly